MKRSDGRGVKIRSGNGSRAICQCREDRAWGRTRSGAGVYHDQDTHVCNASSPYGSRVWGGMGAVKS
jgi:hypothetical protein